MKRIVGTGVCLVLLSAVGACASNAEDPGPMPASGTEGVRVEAQQDVSGSAIKVDVGDVSGYAAVTDFPKDPADRQTVFDMDAGSLQDRLPSCSE